MMAGKKRKAASPPKTDTNSKRAKQNVPVDRGFVDNFPGAANASVFVDPENCEVFDGSLNQTEIGKNANKFYRLQIVKQGNHFFPTFRWGRVGESGQTKVSGPLSLEGAQREFCKKFKDKTGLQWDERYNDPKSGKYTFIEKSWEDDSDSDMDSKKEEDEPADPIKTEYDEETESKLAKPVQGLIELIFNETHFDTVLEDIGYDQNKLPLGKLGKATMKKGLETLTKLSDIINQTGTQTESIEELTNKYYTTIPHVFGRDKPPLIDNRDRLKREIDMLDTLNDMEIAEGIMKKIARDSSRNAMLEDRFSQLNMEEMDPLDPKSVEFQGLKGYLINTAGHTHGIEYTVQDIFRIARSGENDQFVKSEFGNRKDSSRRLLWHGSRTTNFGGILSQGLRIAPPEAPVSGYAFGKGIYLADVSTKSANYCHAYYSGGEGLLLLCEAELGDPMYELASGDHKAGKDAAKAGCIATKGIGRTAPQGWVDAGQLNPNLKGVLMPDASKSPITQENDTYLEYNEYIVYDCKQVRLRYLFRVTM